ncbi:hypothetical protein [Pragia fontium]|uniref:hypothetical protein n=1 Tax=Pragia fontium TaxID=82985 RepID=UPI001F2719D7|nr:hypothetical protein [Pragia fontium]
MNLIYRQDVLSSDWINHKKIVCATYMYLLFFGLMAPLQAETITIGKGSGIVWEGMPFDVKLAGTMDSSSLLTSYGLASISTSKSTCISSSELKLVNGYLVYPIGQGVGIIPRATVLANYKTDNGTVETLNGTIGLPITSATAGKTTITNPVGLYQWCLPPRMTAINKFYDISYNRTSRGVGTWVIIADGTQTSSEVNLEPLYYSSYSSTYTGDRIVQIFPSNITLRISTLECTINTTANIDFSTVTYSKTPGAELGQKSYPMVVNCGQASDKISTNINLQFRAISGLYNGQATRLALNQGGGYITGEMDTGTTGSGACNMTTGLPFNNTRIKIGNISATDSSKSISNQVTWRLCSGGSSLPVGAVTASAEMLVTFN